jgi:pimeloyl-ACP methyl ester carboxylesterase
MNPAANRRIRPQDEIIDGVKLHYLRGGIGHPVVLLHGYPETSYAWRKVIPELMGRFEAVAPDLPGLGQSERLSDGYAKSVVADKIWKLTAALGFEKFALVSADMGGPVAFRIAMEHPEAVSHFVFIESGLPGFGLEQFMDVAKGGSWHFGFFMAAKYPEMLTAGREREFLKSFAYRDAAHVKDAVSDEDIDEYLRYYAASGGMSAGFGYYRSLLRDAQENQRWRGRKLGAPVLAVDGEFGFRGSREAMEQVADNVQGAVIANAGHWVAEEQPEGLLAELIPFLSR